MKEDIIIRAFEEEDYDQAYLLWEQTENLCLGEISLRDPIVRYLKRNPGISSIAEINKELVGTVVVGHDGYRAHIKYLAVKKEFRSMSIGKLLIDRSLSMLSKEHIRLVYLSVKDDNERLIEYWSKFGFEKYNIKFQDVTLMCMEF